MILHIGSDSLFKEHSYFHTPVFLQDLKEKVDHSGNHKYLHIT